MDCADFKNAFREAISSEFEHIPTNEEEIDFIFSDRFNSRMDKMIKSQRKPYWKYVNTASKRAAVILLAALTTLFSALSVKATREPILRFIDFSSGGDAAELITKEYSISQMPDGYEQTKKTTDEDYISTTYENRQGDKIIFSQMATDRYSGVAFDNESGTLYTESIDGIKVTFKEWTDIKIAMWIKDGYLLSIDCFGDVSSEELKQMIRSVQCN